MLDCMVKESSVHGFAYGIISTEGKRYVADPTTYLRTRKILLDPARCIKEVNRILAVLFHTCSYWENIGIKNDVLVVKFYLIDKDSIASLTDLDASLVGICLSFLIEGHDHYCGTKLLNGLRLLDKFFFPVFQGNRVHDAFSLYALQSSKDDAPFGTINHNWNTANLRFRSNQVEKADHGKLAIQHPFVHADVQHLCTTSNLV